MVISEELREKIRKMRSEGKTYREIAEEVGVTETTVSYWCNEKVRQRMKEYARRRWMSKSKEERRTYAKKYREKERYNYIMARYYWKKLSPEQREELLNECEKKG